MDNVGPINWDDLNGVLDSGPSPNPEPKPPLPPAPRAIDSNGNLLNPEKGYELPKFAQKGVRGHVARSLGSSFGFSVTKGEKGLYRAGDFLGVQSGLKSLKYGEVGFARGAMNTAKMGGSIAMKSLGPGFLIHGALQGWKQDGLVGALAGGGRGLAENAMFDMAIGALGGATLATLAAGAGVAYGAYAMSQKGRKQIKNYNSLEMGNVNYGSMLSSQVATTRQRSLLALQNSHINARMGLGQEAMMIAGG